ncbi:MAG: hypothetical protein AAF591_09425 [Verrucomicrobiota bacterium]
MPGTTKGPNWATLLRTIALITIGAFVLQLVQGLWLTALITAAVFAGLVFLWRSRSLKNKHQKERNQYE